MTHNMYIMTGAENTGKLTLTSKWTWFYRIATGKDHNWAATLKAIDSFDTEEDFWDMFHSAIKKPSELGLLRLPVNYSIFRRSILPKWEDPANENGGMLKFEITKTAVAQREPGIDIDQAMEHAYRACDQGTIW